MPLEYSYNNPEEKFDENLTQNSKNGLNTFLFCNHHNEASMMLQKLRYSDIMLIRRGVQVHSKSYKLHR